MCKFICENCGCIDYSSSGSNYWEVVNGVADFEDETANGKLLCVMCTPKRNRDGTINKDVGTWNTRFPRIHWSTLGSREELLFNYRLGLLDIVNVEKYFYIESEECFNENIRMLV